MWLKITSKTESLVVLCTALCSYFWVVPLSPVKRLVVQWHFWLSVFSRVSWSFEISDWIESFLYKLCFLCRHLSGTTSLRLLPFGFAISWLIISVVWTLYCVEQSQYEEWTNLLLLLLGEFWINLERSPLDISAIKIVGLYLEVL